MTRFRMGEKSWLLAARSLWERSCFSAAAGIARHPAATAAPDKNRSSHHPGGSSSNSLRPLERANLLSFSVRAEYLIL